MGNSDSKPKMKFNKTLTNENVAELSTLSGFSPEQVREWHAGFLVSIMYIFLTSCIILTNNIALKKHI